MLHLINHTDRERYLLRVLASMAATLLLLIAVIKLWPAPSGDDPDEMVYTTQGQEVIAMEEIIPTRQKRQAPPPPAPLPPIIVPDDEIIEDEELVFSDSFLPTDEYGEDAEKAPGDDEGAPTRLASVETGPKPVRIVEPKYPREAQRKGIRAEVVLRVLIDTNGRVQDTEIVERFMLKGDDEEDKEPVASIGYGVEESVLAAAERWMFRPARKNGQPVTSYTTLTLGVGVQ